MISWISCLLKDSDLFVLFAENSQILLKISVIPILLTFMYLLVNNQLNSSLNSTHHWTQLIIAAHNCHTEFFSHSGLVCISRLTLWHSWDGASHPILESDFSDSCLLLFHWCRLLHLFCTMVSNWNHLWQGFMK